MPRPRVLVVRAPGTNCNEESAYAFQIVGGEPSQIHINQIVEKPGLLAEFQILCFPGGFSFGDDLGAGQILGALIRHRLNEPMRQFRDAGKLILGICNGFQILIKSGMLLDDNPDGTPQATLTWNESGMYVDRWVNLVVQSDRCVFFRGIKSMYLPIAHAEGKFVPRNRDVLESLQRKGQLVLRYGQANGDAASLALNPENPNGAVANVAGICDESGRVCGLMPHPERHIDPTHHPRWTRGEAGQEGDGLQVFRNAVSYFC